MYGSLVFIWFWWTFLIEFLRKNVLLCNYNRLTEKGEISYFDIFSSNFKTFFFEMNILMGYLSMDHKKILVIYF
jgi:hypothetical protein